MIVIPSPFDRLRVNSAVLRKAEESVLNYRSLSADWRIGMTNSTFKLLSY